MPEVPSIRWGARGKIDALLGAIQPFLIFPLAIIHTRRRIPPSMHRDIQAPTVLGFIAIHNILKPHGQLAVPNDLGLHFLGPFLAQVRHVIRPQQTGNLLCLFQRERQLPEVFRGRLPLAHRLFQVGLQDLNGIA